MAERLTRSRAQAGTSPTVIDPTAELLRLFSEARQDAIAVLQGSVDGRRKLSEACAKVRQASTQLLEMVRDDLEYLEDPMGEGGGLAKTTTARLPQAQAGRAVSFLVDACHMTMRAVLHHHEASPDPPDAFVADGDGSTSDAAATAAAMASAQLWRAAISAATALQDATRLLAVPRFYSAFTITDPSCDALLSLGELAAEVMSRAAAASAAATAAARAQLPRTAVKAEDGTEAAVMAPADACCLLAAHGSSLLLVACEQQPESLLDALLRQPGASRRLKAIAAATLELAAARITETRNCGGCGTLATAAATASPCTPGPAAAVAAASPDLFSFHFRQLQLVALRFSELLADDGSFKAMSKRVLLPALAEALLAEPHRFVSWWGCGRDALYSGLSDRDLLTAPQLTDRSAAAAAATAATSPRSDAAVPPPRPSSPPHASLLPPPPPPPDCAGSHDDKLRTAAVGLLLRSPAARNHILPVLLACVRLPGPGGAGAGLAAFGDRFPEERFICAGEGLEREELYVGGRGRGYKRRKILNPDTHGVNSEQVGAVLTAMATALECAVLLCKVLSNASVDPPPLEAAAAEDAPSLEGGLLQGPQPREQRMGESGGAADAYDPTGGRGVLDMGAGGAAAPLGHVKQESVAAQERGDPAATGGEGAQVVPLASAFLQLLEAQHGGNNTAGGVIGGGHSVKSGSTADGGSDDDALAAACLQIGHMARNLAVLLSLLLPVCPGGGEEVRDSIRQLGYPCLRWPRMNVRLPVLVVDQDCELLTGLLEDLTAAAAEVSHRNEEQRRLRGSEAKRQQERDDRRRKRQEAEQKEAERRQRDKERRQRDRDRAKAMRAAEMAAGGGGGELDCVEALMPNDYGLDGGGGEMAASAAAAAAAGGQQPRVRLVLRRPPVGGGSPAEGAAAAAAGGGGGPRKHGRSSGDGEYVEGYEDAAYGAAQADAVVSSRMAAAGAPYGGNGLGPEQAMDDKEAAALLGMPVPRQRRTTRPTRPHTPTPPPDVLPERVQSAAAAMAAQGPGGGRRHPSSLHVRQGTVAGPPHRQAVGNDDEDDPIIGPPPSGDGGGGYTQQHLPPPHAHPHGVPPRQFPPQQQQQQQQQQQLHSGFAEGPSSVKRLSGGVAGQQQTQQMQRLHRQQQQQQSVAYGMVGQPQEPAPQRPHPMHQHAPQHLPPPQQRPSPPQQQQHHYSSQQQYPQYQYSQQQQPHHYRQVQQQQQQQQQQPRYETSPAGAAYLPQQTFTRGPDSGGSDAVFQRGFAHPQYHQQQQPQPQSNYQTHGSGGGGGAYLQQGEPSQRQPHAADPYGLVQQPLQYQHQHHQQYQEQYQEQYHDDYQ